MAGAGRTSPTSMAGSQIVDPGQRFGHSISTGRIKQNKRQYNHEGIKAYTLQNKDPMVYNQSPTFLGPQFDPRVDYTGVEIHTTSGIWFKNTKQAHWELSKSNCMPAVGGDHGMRAIGKDAVYLTRQPHEIFRK